MRAENSVAASRFSSISSWKSGIISGPCNLTEDILNEAFERVIRSTALRVAEAEARVFYSIPPEKTLEMWS